MSRKIVKRFPADAFTVFATIVAAKKCLTPQERIENLAKATGQTEHVVRLRLQQAKAVGITWRGLSDHGNKRKTASAIKIFSKNNSAALKALKLRTQMRLRESDKKAAAV